MSDKSEIEGTDGTLESYPALHLMANPQLLDR